VATLDIIDVPKTVANRHNTSAAQIALAWLLTQPAVTSVISGAKRPDQLADNLAALDLVLTHDDLAELDEGSHLQPSYPGWIQTYNAKGRVPQGHSFDGPNWVLGGEPV